MLALYSSNSQPPEELKSVQAIYSEKSLQPLALIPQSDEEQVKNASNNKFFIIVLLLMSYNKI